MAAPETVWSILADTSRWSEWNAGVRAIALEGPFATGSWFRMTLPDGEEIRSQLVAVEAPECFVDETWIEQTVVRVTHTVGATASGGSRVVFAIAVEGPDAAAVGEGVSADFPDVLRALAAFAERRLEG